MRFAGLSLPKAGGGISNELLLWGGLGMLALFTWGMAGSTLKTTGTAVERFGEGPIVTQADKFLGAQSNFAWSEGFPWRDRSVWYQWKSSWQGNDPTKRLTVA